MNPLRPGTHTYPTGQRLSVSLAYQDNKARWQRAAKRINDVIKQWPYEKVQVDKADAPKVRKDEKRTAVLTNMEFKSHWFARDENQDVPIKVLNAEVRLFTNATRYEYLVDAALMDRTMDIIGRILMEDLLSGSEFWTTRFWLGDYIEPAVIDGTVDSLESAIRITDGTPVEADVAILTAQQQLQTPAYMDRLRLVHGRVFEEMKGLTGDMKSQLRMTLTEGMARGVGIRDLTGMINKRLSVGMGRARRIARTEINNAYRQAYMDESTELNDTALKGDQYKIMQCHRSALSPTTRPPHAARHGNIYTVQQQKDWWATGANAINCLCSTLDVLVNTKTGEILQSGMIKTMKKQKKEWFPA
ncbi:hypothetical protein [Vibrio phage LP.1]|nr:hypothetical protein [Vibrio phage LP.1]